MAPIIDMKNLKRNKANRIQDSIHRIEKFPEEIDLNDPIIMYTLDILKSKMPNRTFVTYKEAANELFVSIDFIRRRVGTGEIAGKKIGTKPVIHITELARLIAKGVK